MSEEQWPDSVKEEKAMKRVRAGGTFALAAALAMGAIPAFAVTEQTGVADDASDNGVNRFEHASGQLTSASASTKMNVFYNPDQIQATIPLEVTIIATGSPTAAGEIIGPTNYRILNESTNKDIYVRTFKVTEEKPLNWKCDVIGTAQGGTATGATPSGSFGVLDLSLVSGANTAVKADFENAVSSAVNLSSNNQTAWQVPKKSNGTAGSLGMSITGLSLPRDGVGTLTGTVAIDAAFTLNYVVGTSAN